MYLLNEFARKKGSKNTKQRKDKGQKRTKKLTRVSNAPSKEVQEAYLKSRTVRSQTHPYLEGAREARHWATLAHEVSKSKQTRKSNSGIKTARQTMQLAKDIKGLLS